MQKFLLVTQNPNDEAADLNHVDLFDIEKNTISQYFGRILLGSEENYNKYFNHNNFLWLYALGSNCHGWSELDGTNYIRKLVTNNYFELIITFGRPEFEVIFDKNKKIGHSKINNTYVLEVTKQLGLSALKNFKLILVKELAEIECDTKIICFPRISGRVQKYWKKNALAISKSVEYTQEFILLSLKSKNYK